MSDQLKEDLALYYASLTAHMHGRWRRGTHLALCGADVTDCEVFEDADYFDRLPRERQCGECKRVLDRRA